MENFFIIGIFNSANEFISLITFLTLTFSLIHQQLLQKQSGQKNSFVLKYLTFAFVSNSIILLFRQLTHIEKFSGDLPSMMSLFMVLQILYPAIYFLSNSGDSNYKGNKILILVTSLLFVLNFIGILLIITGIELPVMAILLTKSMVLIILIGILIAVSINFKNQFKEHSENNTENSYHFMDTALLLSSIIVSFYIVMQFMFYGICPQYGSVILTLTIINSIVFFKNSKEQKNRYHEVIDELRKSNKILRLEDNKANELKERLIKYFEKNKPYLNKDLSINEVSLYLYTNKTYLSKIINDHMNQNFNQFTNSYRIEEVKRLFLANRSLTIQDLCNKSGFGCMASFTIAFRIFLGSSPADWCKSIRNQWDVNEESKRD